MLISGSGGEASSAAALALGWFAAGWMGVGGAVILSLIAALIIFLQASPIRLRVFPATFAALFFFVLEAAPIWFFLTPHFYVSVRAEYLILLPIYLFALFYLSVRTMKFIFDNIIPQAPGVIMDMFSQATETVARKVISAIFRNSGEGAAARLLWARNALAGWRGQSLEKPAISFFLCVQRLATSGKRDQSS